jgi:hypothetical protein
MMLKNDGPLGLALMEANEANMTVIEHVPNAKHTTVPQITRFSGFEPDSDSANLVFMKIFYFDAIFLALSGKPPKKLKTPYQEFSSYGQKTLLPPT